MQIKNPFRRSGAKAFTAAPEVVSALRNLSWVPWPLLGGGQQQRILEVFGTAQSANYGWMYKNSPAVRTVIDAIVRNVGQLDLRLYEEISESERQPRPDHPAALSLRYPWPTCPSDRFVRLMVRDFLVYDDAFALIAPGVDQQVTLGWLPAYMFEMFGYSFFDADKYRFHRSLRGAEGTMFPPYIDFTPESIWHWRGENPDDPRRGFSKLETLRQVVAEDAALQQAIIELANSGMIDPSYVKRPMDAPEWTNEALTAFEEELTNRLRRANRTPPVMEEGMTLERLGVSPRDAEMLAVRKYAVTRVAGEYGLPLAMAGLEGDLNEARTAFYTDTLPPITEAFVKSANLRILVQTYGERSYCFEFDLDEKHMGDERMKALVSATGRAVMLTNEGRAKLNLPPLDGGDELVTPLNVIVGEKPSPQVMPVQDPNAPPQDGSYRTDQPAPGPPPPPKRVEVVEVKQLEPQAGPASAPQPEPYQPVPQLVERRKTDRARQLRYVDEAKGLLDGYYRDLKRRLQSKDLAGVPWDDYDRQFGDKLEKFVASVVEREGGIYVAKLLGEDFDMGPVRNYVKAMGRGVAESLNQVTRQDVEDIGVADAITRARGQRADVAAAAIGSRAAVFARYEAAKQAPQGDLRQKVWVADTGRHEGLDGETVPLGERFSAGHDPGFEPNCRCSLSII